MLKRQDVKVGDWLRHKSVAGVVSKVVGKTHMYGDMIFMRDRDGVGWFFEDTAYSKMETWLANWEVVPEAEAMGWVAPWVMPLD